MNFTSVSALLGKRDRTFWELYWQTSGKPEESFFKFYPQYVSALITKIKTSGAKRVFLIHSDRALFLAGFLAALHADIPLVLPPSDASGLLKDLLRPEDALLTDQEALAPLTSFFISMANTEICPEVSVNFEILNSLNVFITFYTSGSTGVPKTIQKSLKQLEEEILVLEEMWGTTNGKCTFLSTVPHNHIYGLLFSLLWPVCGGYSLKCQTFSYWEDLLKQCEGEDCVISSPSHLGRFPLLRDEKVNPRQVFSSGGLLSFEEAQSTQEFLGVCPTEVYGSTETGGIAYRQQEEQDQPWTKFKGINLSEGEGKRLCLRSLYLPNMEVYQTEDRVVLESEHQFHLLGRADRTVKVEGKRVCLIEMEQRLREIEHIEEASVILLETLKRDELGALIILSTKGQERLLSIGKEKFIREIRKSLSAHFDRVTLPRKWRFVSEIPLNAQGKFSYPLLKAYFGDSQ